MPKTLIVYTHGAISSPISFTYLANIVKEELGSNYVHEFFEYDLHRTPAQEIANKLSAFVRKMARKYDVRDVIYVGHSYGGVLSVEAAFHNSLLFEQEVITLAAPLHGVEIPFLLRMLRPSLFIKNVHETDEFMSSLQAKLVDPPPFQITSVVTVGGNASWLDGPNDGVISVKSQVYKYAEVRTLMFNHFEVLLSLAVAAFIVERSQR